jgi:replicative DNA helicase
MENYNKRKARPNPSIDEIAGGKIPPSDMELEKTILGAALLEAQACKYISVYLKEEMFYKESNAVIFSAIKGLVESNRPVDIITVSGYLRKLGKLDLVGGAYGLTEITNNVSSTAHLEYWCRALQEMYTAREGIKKGYDLVSRFFNFEENIDELVDHAVDFFKNLVTITKKRSKTNKQHEQQILDKLDQGVIIGELSGFTLLDFRLGGFQDSDLIIVAARPGIGKTVFALTVARKIRSKKKKTAIYSYEMGGSQLVQRIISADLSISSQLIRTNKLSDSEKDRIRQYTKITNPDFIINDDCPDIDTLTYLIEDDVVNNDAKLIVIDYLQLIPGSKSKSNASREQEVSDISRKLKLIAKKLNVPIMALSQVSRLNDGEPQLKDLRESGAIEQDADVVIFITRVEEKTVLHIKKFRHGEADFKVPLKYIKDFVTFVDDDGHPKTRAAIAYYEKYGEINMNFEEVLKKDESTLTKDNNEQSESGTESGFPPIAPF